MFNAGAWIPIKLENLQCYNNNIKYLSPHNCKIIKNIEVVCIFENPIYDNFKDIWEFLDSL